MARKIEWGRSKDGVCESKDGRFSIYPEYMGTTRPQGYALYDNVNHKKCGSGDNQGHCKYDAQRIVDEEEKLLRRRQPSP